MTTKPKKSRTNNMPKTKSLHEDVVKMCDGRDLTTIPFISDYTAMKLIMELGTDLKKFPSCKQFTSWLGLAPRSKQSGKTSRNIKSPKTRAGQIIRESVSGGLTTKNNSIAERGRKISYRRGKQVAYKAMARMVAIEIYNVLSHGELYIEHGVEKYLQKEIERKQKTLSRLAKELGMTVLPTQCA